MQVRQLEFLTALDRERHFGRAAAACKISQPALSQALRSIEQAFGVPIVDRRQHGFHGFTPQGERILAWARRVLSDRDALVQEIGAVGGEALSGHIRLGAIPVTTPMIGILTTAFHRQYPGVTIAVRSMNFTEIERGLERFEVDVGINYLDAAPSSGLRAYALYTERYYLLTPKDSPMDGRTSVSWAEAAALPLCLLTPDMQNRRIIESMFAQAGAGPRTVVETNCAVTLCSHVRSGAWFTIVPQTFLHLLGDWTPPAAIPLTDPAISNEIGLFIHERNPLPPVVHAFVETAQSLRIDDELAARPAPAPQW